MDINSPIALLSAFVGAVVFLRIFFTVWGPLDRKLNGKAARRPDVGPADLQGSTLNVHFTSGVVLENVTLVSRYGLELDDLDDPDELSQVLTLRAQDGRRLFARTSQIDYLEQAPAVPPPPPALHPSAPILPSTHDAPPASHAPGTFDTPDAPDAPGAPDVPGAPDALDALDPDAPENWS